VARCPCPPGSVTPTQPRSFQRRRYLSFSSSDFIFGLMCGAEAAQPLAERLREQGESADHDLSIFRRRRSLWRRRSALSISRFTSLAASSRFTDTVTLGFGVNKASASAGRVRLQREGVRR
jgi:hypothetical protein